MFDQALFSERLKNLRTEKGLSQSALGAMIGVSNHAVYDMENGRRTTTMEKIYMLAEVLETTSDYLIGLSDVRER